MATDPIGLLYEATIDPALWSGALAAIAEDCGAAFTHLFWRDHDKSAPLSVTGRESDPHADALYAAHYYKIDWRLPAAERIPAGRAYTCADHIDNDFVARSELYQDFLIPFDLRYTIVGNLVADSKASAVLALLRTPRHGPFERAAVSRVQAFLPHVTRAVHISRRLAAGRTADGALHVALDLLERGAILVDRNARIRSANSAAEHLLDGHRGLRAINGVLSASEPDDDTALKRLIATSADVACGEKSNLDVVVAIRRAPGQRPLLISAVPVPARAAQFVDADEPSTLLLVTEPRSSNFVLAERLEQTFGLTPAEAEVAVELREGRRIREIAARRNTSLETVRSQVKAIYAKTGVDSHVAFLAQIRAIDPFEQRTQMAKATELGFLSLSIGFSRDAF